MELKKTRWITLGHDLQDKQKHLSREHSEPLERHHGQLVLKKNDSRNMALAHAQYIELTLPKLTKFEKCTSDKKSHTVRVPQRCQLCLSCLVSTQKHVKVSTQ